MDLKIKLEVLAQVYKIYDDFLGSMAFACKKYCAWCCTPNVTMTTIEGYMIAGQLLGDDRSDLFARLKAASDKKRFQPKITTNQLADLCIRNKDIPDEENNLLWGKCLLLTENLCSAYNVRPFGCRCFVSNHLCGEKGCADVDPFIISVNTLFLQFIEHIDSKGFYGNLIDILCFMESKENRQAYRLNNLSKKTSGLICNHPVKVFPIPPEHRDKIKPVLNALYSIKVPMNP